jgi:hypothetical protein
MSRANPSGRSLKAIAVVHRRLVNSPATRGHAVTLTLWEPTMWDPTRWGASGGRFLWNENGERHANGRLQFLAGFF